MFKHVTSDRVYKHCIRINAPHMCAHRPNHEVCADKLFWPPVLTALGEEPGSGLEQ